LVDHLSLLGRAVQAEWASSVETRPNALKAHVPRSTLNMHEIIDSGNGNRAYSWVVSPMYGCLVVAISTDVRLREDLRNKGIGKYMRAFRTNALRRAGFQTELCTVRTDNEIQNKVMTTSGAQPVCEFPSDRGGTIRLWRTELPAWDGPALADIPIAPFELPNTLASHESSGAPGAGVIAGRLPVHFWSDRVQMEPWTVLHNRVTCPTCLARISGTTESRFYQLERRTPRVPGTRDVVWIEHGAGVTSGDAAHSAIMRLYPSEAFGYIATVSHVSADDEAVTLISNDGQVLDIPARRPGGSR
jgi:hypothetical protein